MAVDNLRLLMADEVGWPLAGSLHEGLWPFGLHDRKLGHSEKGLPGVRTQVRGKGLGKLP
jgi:hypothetical protein